LDAIEVIGDSDDSDMYYIESSLEVCRLNHGKLSPKCEKEQTNRRKNKNKLKKSNQKKLLVKAVKKILALDHCVQHKKQAKVG
jgi:hypothetical protein